MSDTTRRLAAILFADITGYTAMMQRDEQAAMDTLSRFKQTLETKTADFQGTIIQYYGDGCLVVFDSPVSAVSCAKAMQEVFGDVVPVRIGIHLGDVVFQESNAYGDAVNIASRIESMGVPGAVLLSQTVRRQIKNHPEFQLASLGSFEFKNVEEPMEVFALVNEGFPVPKRAALTGKFKTAAIRNHNATSIIVGTGLIFLALYAGYRYLYPGWSAAETDTPDSMAIFPFEVKGRPDIMYLGEGMVDLITAKLDEIPGINSIDPNLIFSKLGTGLSVSHRLEESARLARSMGASTFVLGSIVEAGQVLQITAFKYNAAGKLLGKHRVECQDSEQLTKYIDELIKRLVAEEMGDKGQELNSLAALTSENFESLKAYLKGEQACRDGKYQVAYNYFDQATRTDSTFALAWMRMVDASAWFENTDNRAMAKWKAFKHKLPQKWQEYHEAFILYRNGDRRTETALLKLIHKYGESRAFVNCMAEFLHHFGPLYGRSDTLAKRYLVKALELEPNNVEALFHLGDIARLQQDRNAIKEILSKIKPESDIYPDIKTNAWILQDSVTDAEIESLLSHPYLRPIQVAKTFYPIKDKGINYGLNHRVVTKYNNEAITDVSRIWVNATKGNEAKAYLYWDSWATKSEPFGKLPLDRYKRCLPATLMADVYFSPLSEKYAALYEETNGRETPWELYAAIKYALALKKKGVIDKLRSKLLKKTKEPGWATQASYYFYSLRAYEARLAGDNDAALRYIDSAYCYPLNYMEIQTSSMDKTIMRANIYAEKGDFESAIVYFENLPHQIGGEFVAGYATYRLSQWYENSGNLKRSLIKCELLLKTYRDCDRKYRIWLEETEKRKARLIAKLQ